MNEKKSYKVSIFGDTYSLLSDESEEHIIESARLIDDYMQEIAGKFSSQPRAVQGQKCAVLAALRIASSLLKEQGRQKQQQQANKDLVAWIDQELLSIR